MMVRKDLCSVDLALRNKTLLSHKIQGQPIYPHIYARILKRLKFRIICNWNVFKTGADPDVEEAEEAGAIHMLDSATVGKHSFTAMAGDHDQLTRQRLQRSPSEQHAIQHERV